jgi:serine protease Do
VQPVVVSISVSKFRGQEISWTHTRRSPAAVRYGSGVIIDTEGHALTNNHVVDEAIRIRVSLSDGTEYPAEIIGQDPDTDLALIRLISQNPIDTSRVARIGNSDAIQVGDWVMAVGSPFGFHHTVSVGVISAKGRHLGKIEGDVPPPSYQNFLQTDASINPGNSGGPLIDMAGRVVGINTAYNPAGSGIGFAIPIRLAAKVASELRQNGEVVRGYLGIDPQDLTPDIAEALGLASFQGVLVGQIQPDSPAEQGGVKRGDVILKLAGRPVADVGSFLTLVADHRPQERLELSVLRNGTPLTLIAVAGRRSSINHPSTRPAFAASDVGWPGLEVKNRWDMESRRLRIPKTGQGVVVTYIAPGGPAEQKEIARGDVIFEIDRVAIWNVRDYHKIVDKAQNRSKPLLFLLLKKDRGHTWFVALRPMLKR